MYASRIMRRTTIMLPDDLDRRVRSEARRRGTSVAEIVREAVEGRYPPRDGRLSFIAIGEGDEDGGRRVDEVVREVVLRKHDARD